MKTIYDLNLSDTNLPIPEHTLGALERYFFMGLEPGSFLTAVLEGNLFRAVQCADHINKAALSDIVTFIYNRLPGGTYGSRDLVKAWLEDREGRRTKYVEETLNRLNALRVVE